MAKFVSVTLIDGGATVAVGIDYIARIESGTDADSNECAVLHMFDGTSIGVTEKQADLLTAVNTADTTGA